MTKWFFRVSAPVVMIILAGVNRFWSQTEQYNPTARRNDKEIDMLKYAAFNLDLRKPITLQVRWRS